MFGAARAGAAAGKPQHHAIARCDFGHARSHRFDHAGAFVAKHGGQRKRHELVAEHDIGMAQPDTGNPHQHFAGLGRRQIERFDDEIAVRLVSDGGGDLHGGGSGQLRVRLRKSLGASPANW